MDGATNDYLCHEATLTDQHGAIKTLKIPVVQELMRQGVQDVPKMFIRPSCESTVSDTNARSKSDIPYLNLAKLRAVRIEERKHELEKLARGLREWGMVFVSDHGIPVSLLGAVKEVVKGFFELSIEEKRNCVGTYASVDNMGYGRNYIKSQDQVLEWIDRLTMMAAPKNSTDGLNVWPQNPVNFRDVFEQYAEEARKAGDKLLQVIAEALSLQEDTFLKYFDTETSEIKVRINYYPPCPQPGSTLGINPHSDPSALSLLIEFDNSGGLHAMHKDEDFWRSIPWPTDALLVLAGDLLEIMSNGRVYSAYHRVVTQADVDRWSVAMFYNPPTTMEIEPQKNDHSDDEYKKVVVGEYVKHYYKNSPAPSKQAVIGIAKV